MPDAGLFWYHPHVDSAAQVGYGLSGPLLVEDPKRPIGPRRPARTRALRHGRQRRRLSQGPSLKGGTRFGREGNALLVNGRIDPILEARSGLRQRWRLVNAAKSRYFQLALDGHTFTRIGGDGGFMSTRWRPTAW